MVGDDNVDGADAGAQLRGHQLRTSVGDAILHQQKTGIADVKGPRFAVLVMVDVHRQSVAEAIDEGFGLGLPLRGSREGYVDDNGAPGGRFWQMARVGDPNKTKHLFEVQTVAQTFKRRLMGTAAALENLSFYNEPSRA